MHNKTRCSWAGELPIYQDYHDQEWGRPLHDDQRLFEMLVLEAMQAGLSWLTVLKKRAALRRAFDGFDPAKVARYDEAKIQQLLADPAIIRNRLKIRAAVTNAQAFLKVQEKYGSFDAFLWAYVDGKPIQNHREKISQIPARTPLSDRISADLKKMGFKFVGSTIMYAFMQSTGMVNDHVKDCFVYQKTKA